MKYFWELTDEEYMDLYNHNSRIKEMGDNGVEYVKNNFPNDEVFEGYSVLDALKDAATNVSELRDEWLIVVSGYEIIEIQADKGKEGRPILIYDICKEV